MSNEFLEDKNDQTIIYSREKEKYIEELKQGSYLGLTENYVSNEQNWTMDRVSRDIWQNFYDGNNRNLDGIVLDVENNNGIYNLKIHGDAEYDYRRLLHFGAGSKTKSQTSAGQYGDGVRMVALHLLRDYGFQSVKYRSGFWELEFYLEKLPDYKLPEDINELRGLCCKLRILEEKYNGNNIELVTINSENIKKLNNARDYFYHSENEDFKNPDIDNNFGGIKLHIGEAGNIYINGQRIHFNSKTDWNKLDDITVWTWYLPSGITLGRDRPDISSYEFDSIILPFLVSSMEQEECKIMLEILEPAYYVDAIISTNVQKLLELIIIRLENERYKHKFPDNMVAKNIDSYAVNILKNIGYKICKPIFAKIGMKLVSKEYEEMVKLSEVEMSDFEKQRAMFIQEKVDMILKDSKAIDPEITARPIKVFNGDHPFANGKYGGDFVFLNQHLLKRGNLPKLLTIYLHEICHVKGSDESAEFSYALTDLLEHWTCYLLNNPEYLTKINEEFKQIIDNNPQWLSYNDFIIEVESLFKKEELKLHNEYNIDINKSSYLLKDIIYYEVDYDKQDFSADMFISIDEELKRKTEISDIRDYFDGTLTMLDSFSENLLINEKKEIIDQIFQNQNKINKIQENLAIKHQRTRALERAILESSIPQLKEKVIELKEKLEDIHHKLRFSSSFFETNYSRLKNAFIYDFKKYNLIPFSNFISFFISFFEIMIEKNKDKPVEYVLEQVDKFLVYFNENVKNIKNSKKILANILKRMVEDIYFIEDQTKLLCAQKLFNEYMRIEKMPNNNLISMHVVDKS